MTDRELLELAAKAGGYDNYEYVENEYRDGRKVTGHYDSLLEVCINPLSDDGDALRLAVKLYFDVRIAKIHKDTFVYFFGGVSADEAHRKNPYFATRKAIVKAAAEIGKGLK